MACVWWRANNNLPAHAYISLLRISWPLTPYLPPLTPFKPEFKLHLISGMVIPHQIAGKFGGRSRYQGHQAGSHANGYHQPMSYLLFQRPNVQIMESSISAFAAAVAALMRKLCPAQSWYGRPRPRRACRIWSVNFTLVRG